MDMYLLRVRLLGFGLLRRSGHVVLGLLLIFDLALASTLGGGAGLLGGSALTGRGLGGRSGRAFTAGADAGLDGGSFLLLQLLKMLPVEEN